MGFLPSKKRALYLPSWSRLYMQLQGVWLPCHLVRLQSPEIFERLKKKCLISKVLHLHPWHLRKIYLINSSVEKIFINHQVLHTRKSETRYHSEFSLGVMLPQHFTFSRDRQGWEFFRRSTPISLWLVKTNILLLKTTASSIIQGLCPWFSLNCSL